MANPSNNFSRRTKPLTTRNLTPISKVVLPIIIRPPPSLLASSALQKIRAEKTLFLLCFSSLPLSILFLLGVGFLLPLAEGATDGVCQLANGQMRPHFPGGEACQDPPASATLNCEEDFGPGVTYDKGSAPYRRLTTGRKRNLREPRSEACDEPALKVGADMCPFTCAMCCRNDKYACENHPLTTSGAGGAGMQAQGQLQCRLPEDRALCDSRALASIVQMVCPALCGTCDRLNTIDPTCRDTIAIFECGTFKANGLCQDQAQRTDMQAKCPRTCGFCKVKYSTSPATGGGGLPPMQPPPPTIAPTDSRPAGGRHRRRHRGDRADNCHENRKLCDSDIYYSLMRDDCAATCRRYFRRELSYDSDYIRRRFDDDFFGDDAVVGCNDERDDCDYWDRYYNFCTNDYYSDEERENSCAYTCGYC